MIKSNFALFLLLFLLGLILISSGKNPVVLGIERYLAEIQRPFIAVISPVRNTLLFWQSAFLNIRSIKENNEVLSRENLGLYGKLAKLSEIEVENELLRERLKLSKKGINAMSAAIIGRDFQNSRSFIVNKGSNDGISPGMAVISEGETAIGKITDVSPNAAKVQTIFDTQSRIAAVTADTRITGLVRGLGSDIILDLVAKNKIPNGGELIISSGAEGSWPRGLIIGKIKEVKSGDNQIFNVAGIEMIVNPQDLIDVFIVLNK